MTKKQTCDRITAERVIAVLRLQRVERLEELVGALESAGITIVEITLDTPEAAHHIKSLSKKYPKCMFGAGTVLGYESAVQAVEAGAKFLVSPVTDLDMIAVANEMKLVAMAGALTPTEAFQAWQAGTDFVKLFPLAGLGPDYLRALRGPLPMIKYVPTNGVTLENAPDFLKAGAAAVGLGRTLVSNDDLDSQDFHNLNERVKKLMTSLDGIR